MFTDVNFITNEQLLQELEAVEIKLAERLGIKSNIRATLINLDKENLLIEDELVADWHQLYANLTTDLK